MALRFLALVVSASLLLAPTLASSQANASTAGHIEAENELTPRLSQNQRQQFDAAKKSLQARDYKDALTGFKALLHDLPADPLLSKWTADAAIENGDAPYAAGLLKPVVQANFEDWQAVAMLARAAAESGDSHTRDAAMVNMAMLHQHGLNLPQYTLERMAVGEDAMTILCFLSP